MRRRNTITRTRGLIAASAAAVLTTGLIASSATADPEVTADDVREAYHELSAVNEKLKGVSADIEEAQKEISSLTADIEAKQAEYDKQSKIVAESVVRQQTDYPLGASVNVLGSDDPEKFIDGLIAAKAVDTTQAQQLQTLSSLSDSLENRKAGLKDREEDLLAKRTKLKKQQSTFEARHAEVEQQYERLNADEQADASGASSEQELKPSDLKASSKAGKAVEFARAQVGDAYAYGGTGPDAWDCSGLTQAAWGAAGVSIPRVVGPQFAAGREIPLSAVQPGDLVFYADMSHVGIYVGNGQVVHAANPRTGTNVTSIGENFAKAARVG